MTATIVALHTSPSPAELEAELAQLSARIDAATHRLLTLIRAIDEAGIWATQGARSFAAWLGWRLVSALDLRGNGFEWRVRWLSCRSSTGRFPRGG